MPTVLRTFPEISRVGHQETGWSAPIPAAIRFLDLKGVAADAVWEDLGNAMVVTIFVSPDGTDETAIEVLRYDWNGGTHQTKPIPPGTIVPNTPDITFGPMEQDGGPHYIGFRVKVAVDIPVAMVFGATVTALP
jgi:hypothetical protein